MSVCDGVGGEVETLGGARQRLDKGVLDDGFASRGNSITFAVIPVLLHCMQDATLSELGRWQ